MKNLISKLLIYDNGGKTADRFTVLFPMFPPERDGSLYGLGMNREPFHPQGIGQHISGQRGAHLGKRIAFEEMPEDCQKFIRQEFSGELPLKRTMAEIRAENMAVGGKMFCRDTMKFFGETMRNYRAGGWNERGTGQFIFRKGGKIGAGKFLFDFKTKSVRSVE